MKAFATILKNKRLWAGILTFVMIFSLVSCSGKSDAPNLKGDGNWWSNSQGGAYADKNQGDLPLYGAQVGGTNEDMTQCAPEAGEPGLPDGEEDDTPDQMTPGIIENPMIQTAENNVSTFSADVDTASYSYFRKLLKEYGYTLQDLQNNNSGIFRTEEFINYFKYDVAEPHEGELFGVHAEIAPCPWNSENRLLRLTLQAENAKPAAGNNLVFLIDVSGSMGSEDKLPLLKKAFGYLVDALGPDDTVSIVTYSGREAVVLDGCKGTDRTRILNAINNLNASGSTNGEAGLTMAYRLAESHMIEGGNNRIIMASDGDLNVGISSAEQLKQYVEEKRGQGVYLSVLGFGSGNYKDNNMEALADNGNGVYYYIDGVSEAEKVFGTDLLGTLYTVAEDVKLQLTFDKNMVEAYRLIGYENRMMKEEDFRDDTKDAGEVGASHQVTVCYELKLTAPDAQMDITYMTLAVRYKDPGAPLAKENSYLITGSYFTNGQSDDMQFISALIELSMLLRNSKYVQDVTVDGIYAKLESLNLTDSYKIEFREMVKGLVK